VSSSFHERAAHSPPLCRVSGHGVRRAARGRRVERTCAGRTHRLQGAVRVHGRSDGAAGRQLRGEAGVADPAIASIVSEDGRHVAVAITIAGAAALPTSGSSLVFRKFGDEYFLERVVSTGGSGRDIVLTPRRMERDLALRSASGSAGAAEDGR